MARARKTNVTIEELIKAQEDAVARAKAKYDTEVGKLKDLYTKRDEQKKKELLRAVESSNKSYEEILAFLKAE